MILVNELFIISAKIILSVGTKHYLITTYYLLTRRLEKSEFNRTVLFKVFLFHPSPWKVVLFLTPDSMSNLL